MYLSVMNALIKLLLSQGNKINCLWGVGGRGGEEGGRVRFSEKVVTDVPAHVLGFSGVNFCLGIRLLEVTFVRHKVVGNFFMNNA